MDQFDKKRVVSHRILFLSDINLMKITMEILENFVSVC